jgi:hypothetical protein
LAPGGLSRAPLVANLGLPALADAIDLNQPWFAPWAPWLEEPLKALRRGCSVAQALNQTLLALGPGHAAQGLRFVPQTHLPPGAAYEAFIHRTRQVPTRDNLHDLFNGVCWLRFPVIKRHLNALQTEQIDRLGVGQIRGAVRDALTLMDENALLLSGPEPLRLALQAHDWHGLFVRHRDLWTRAHPVLFGHALLEKLVRPYKSITAHVFWVDGPEGGGQTGPIDHDAMLEHALPERLCAPHLATKPFMPLPVLGLPGWSLENETPDFYADQAVFRPGRR